MPPPPPRIPKLGLKPLLATRPRRTSSLSAAPDDPPALLSRLGKGSYGSVWAARQRVLNGERLVAVKIVALPPAISEQDEDAHINLEKEIEMMRSFSHAHIVTFFDAFVSTDEIWVVMEQCELGSLHDVVQACPLSDDEVGAVCHSVLLGLRYLHEEKRTIHRDVKGANLLLTAAGVVKLADFGVSSVTQGTMAQADTVIGSPMWMAPEVITGGGYNAIADVWSLGITAMELAQARFGVVGL